MRRTLGYFIKRKFGDAAVEKLKEYGFEPGSCTKIVVSWGWTCEAEDQATRENIELWDFRRLMRELDASIKNKRSYFTDDTLRTIGLYARAVAPAGGTSQLPSTRSV